MKKILLLSLAIAAVSFTASAQFQRTPTPNDTLKNVRTLSNGNVLFSIYAPKARTVGLSGDIVPWGTPLKSVEHPNGVWTIEVPNVEPGAYRYNFTVDGSTVYDPKAPLVAEQKPVARIGENMFWSQKDVEHGAVSQIYYKSKAHGTTRRMHIWTPAGYNASKDKLPVFYLIHGGGDNDASWPGVGCAGDILDNLYAEGKIVPMIVVMPDGSGDVQQFVDGLVGDIMPYMAKNYRIKTGAQYTAIAGLSMGGLETLESFMQHPDLFGYINVMSAGWFENDKAMYESGEKRLSEITPTLTKTVKYLKFTMGGETDIAYYNCKSMLKVFDKCGIKYEYTEMPGGHSWYVWRHDLNAFAPSIFR